MITPDYVRTMAAYNAEMNRRLYDAAGKLSDAERKQQRGAFWSTIHGTLNHVLWGDRAWMSRFAGWPKPDVPIKQSAAMYDHFDALAAERRQADENIIAWADGVDAPWLAGDLTWVSAAVNREFTRPRGFLVTHMFNHQTHHRGQAHAMITAAGQPTGDTDLFLVVEPQ
jgi:uncharacterized damage-inducible protein DinB